MTAKLAYVRTVYRLSLTFAMRGLPVRIGAVGSLLQPGNLLDPAGRQREAQDVLKPPCDLFTQAVK